ncbi:MAG: thrombospondin type 3 repeat-containing protein [Pseudomonadales bacterium]|nr:thrombospondin type 3 repeat-containing protein [Pseudomonadales bacterium]
MHIRDLTKLVVVGFLFSLLAACGGGGTSRDCAPTNPNCNDPEQIINVQGADGPMANAVVELFRLSDFLGQPPSPPSLLDADARTDANGLATLTLKAADEDGSKPGDGPFLLRISSNGGTSDTTTGEAPAITSVGTIISAAQFANRASTRFYATPFTSLAVERAKGRVIAAGGDSSDPAAVEAELAAASVEVLQAVGFGMATDIDIFNTPPIIDETTVTLEEQQAVAAYRMAIETFAEVVAQAANSLGQSTDIVLEAIKIDIADGLIGDSPSTIEQAVVDAVNTVDSGYLTDKERLPSADGSATIEALLEGEFPDVSAPLAGAIDSVPAAADFDGDGFANTNDSAPYDPEVSGDSDSDGVDDAGDNCLSGWKVPADQTNPDQTDTDNDGTGDICDADQDADGVDDGQDNCLGGSDVFNTYTNTPQSIFDPDQANNDNDAFGDICDDDIDGDNALNIDDDQPFDPSVTSDKDGDGVDDVSGDGDNCIDTSFGGADTFNLFAIEGVGDERVFSTTVVQALDDPSQGDRDDNGIGDLCDNDADGDGVLNAQDSLPFDPNSAGDADSDGVDDSTDNCIDVSFGGLQEMNPGESLSDPDQTDTDLDGLGDICDLDKDGDTIPNDKDPSELENTVSYHFDSFLLQQSSEAGSFKLETIGESVLRDTNEVVVSALANQLDLGSDSVNDNTFIVSSEYQTAENSLLLAGAGFGAAVATEVQQPPEARALVSTDTTITASYAEPNLTLDGVELFPWGKSSFVGTQGLSLPVVGAGPLVAARDQGLTTLLYTDASHENADLNGSYGFVDLRIAYDSAVSTALVATQSRIYTMAFDGAGLVTPANVGVNQFDAVVGQGSAGDGSVKYSEPQLTPAGYSVSLDGAVTITGTDLRAMTDADGELIAVSADNLRGFGVRLDATATQADLLAGSPYALQGLFINPALNSLTAGSLNSAELSFADVNGSIKATLNFGGSSISTSDYSEPDTLLPNVSIAARNTQQSSDEVNRAVTITNGQLGRIEMGSYIPGDETPLSVELEGFFVKGKGLLLRFIETPIAAVGGGAGPATTNFYCGDPAAVEFVQLNPNGAPPTVIVPQPTNNPSCGFIIVGDSGALTKVSERARNDVGNEQLYSDILSEAGASFFEDKSGFAQGIVWGIPTSP